MKDLTKGSILRHVLSMAAPLALGIFTQTAYQLVDLYFITRVGVAAIAGVAAASAIFFVVLALTQVLAVGTMVLIAHASGRQDRDDANLVFNQSVALAATCGTLVTALLFVLIRSYLLAVSKDAATIDAGVAFIHWMLPGYWLMFPLTVLGSALRGTGIVQPTIVISVLSVVVNIVLAPILIAGWGTGHPLGVQGAGLASSLSILLATVMMGVYFAYRERFVSFVAALMRPRLEQWKRMLVIGLPAGGELLILSLWGAVMYYATRNLGASVQAGVGIGARVLQAIMLPAMAIAFTVGPIAGQNFGAKDAARVRETFRKVALVSIAVMVAATVVAQYEPGLLVKVFSSDAATMDTSAVFVQIASWSFVAEGLVLTCGGMFQALGNTVPALVSSCLRLLAFALPALWLSALPQFNIAALFYWSVAAVALQALISLWLLNRELARRLAFPDLTASAAPPSIVRSATPVDT